MTRASGGGGPPSRRPLPRQLLAGDTLEAARHLLGARLVHDRGGTAPATVGRIVEVEAYVGRDDRASHARMGPTARNRVMFDRAGTAYVYLVYGMHHCLNVVTGPEGFPAAVLIRAVDPITGFAPPRDGGVGGGRAAHRRPEHRVAAGPGLVGAAFGVDRGTTGLDLCDPASPLRLEHAAAGDPAPDIVATPRIGIAFAGSPWTDLPWRFVDARSRALSRPLRSTGTRATATNAAS